jgi:bacillithiol synthase
MNYEVLDIAFEEAHILNPLVQHYLSNKNEITAFYHSKPDIDGINACAKSYQNFSPQQREVLVNVLTRQAALVKNTSAASLNAIQLLSKSNTHTVTTGHQLCLFTGPLYFIYKLLSVINLAETLRKAFPENNYVPVYWMASEDHDIEEIQSFRVFGKTLKWETPQQGAVGNLNTEGLQAIAEQLKTILGESENVSEILNLFEKAYLQESNLANATRTLVNELFGRFGLVVVDGNDTQFKKLFQEEFKKDILNGQAFSAVNETIKQLQNVGYDIQVNPRPINVFYLKEQLRARIEKTENGFQVLNSTLRFSEKELLEELEQHPERFSPNVVLRPLYQQKLLPNIAYVGGPGELAYWLEYKLLFETFKLNMPVLMPRQFVLIVEKNSQQKIAKLGLTENLFFQSEKTISDTYLKQQEQVFDLNAEAMVVSELYEKVKARIITIDKSLEGTVGAERQKAISGLESLAARTNKAIKQKSEQELKQIQTIKAKLFPEGVPQERIDNFAQYALKYGIENWINELKVHLHYSMEGYNAKILREL